MKIFATSFVKFFSLFFSFLIMIITAKYYGAEGRGYLAAGMSLVTMFATFGGLSIGRVIVFMIADSKTRVDIFYREKLISIFAVFFSLSFLALLIASLTYTINSNLFGKIPPSYLILMFLALPYFMWQSYSNYVFASLKALVNQNKIILINRSIFLVVALVSITVFKVNLHFFLSIFVFFNILNFLSEIVFVFKSGKPLFQLDCKFIYELIKNGLKVHLDTIGGVFIASANILIINYYLTSSDVGIFQLATRFTMLLTIVPVVVQLYIQSDIAHLGPDKAWDQQKRYIFLTMIFVLLTMGITYYFFPLIIPLLTNRDFLPSINIFHWLLLGVIGNCFSILMAPQWTGRGYLKTISFFTIIFGTIGLVIALYLVPKIGIYGAVYANIIVYTIAFIGNLIYYVFVDKQVYG